MLRLLAAVLAAALPGTYATTITGAKPALLNGSWLVQLRADGSYAIEHGGAVVVRGRGAVTGPRITFGHEIGPLACPGPATYRWSLHGRTLTLTPLAESCAGRRLVLASHPLPRHQPRVPTGRSSPASGLVDPAHPFDPRLIRFMRNALADMLRH